MKAMSRAFSFTGSTTIVSGASSGLGAIFARTLAPRAETLILVARSGEALETLAQELRDTSPELNVFTVTADLASEEGRSRLWDRISQEKLAPNALINNAGLGDYGLFATSEASRISQQIDVNITALTLLTHRFLNSIQAGSAGRPAVVLNVSSIAGETPLPDLAVYAASKAYVTSLSEALAIELAGTKVRVLAVCPGPTPTNFGNTARRKGASDIDRTGQNFLEIPPERVVCEAIRAAEGGKYRHFPGKRVAAAALGFRCVPRILRHALLQRRFRKGNMP